ncbi:MAG: hypothetical protein JO308_15980 [Verrucomicrobia bacterium]|nr:hypothetical protein [Verrucomicrobiota bacterium]
MRSNILLAFYCTIAVGLSAILLVGGWRLPVGGCQLARAASFGAGALEMFCLGLRGVTKLECTRLNAGIVTRVNHNYCQRATANWQLATGNWQLATGNWQLATGNWQLAVDRKGRMDTVDPVHALYFVNVFH